jgi:hypothetical protein
MRIIESCQQAAFVLKNINNKVKPLFCVNKNDETLVNTVSVN